MRIFGVVVLVASIVFAVVVYIVFDVRADYEYDNTIESYWKLSVKASTLQGKSDYLDAFVKALEDARLSGHDAVIFKTPDNSYDGNMNALHSLQARMHEIRGMDVTSFPYQQAIQQVTAQEQDEAHGMLEVFNGVWFLQHHPVYWGWIGFVVSMTLLGMAVIGIVFIGIG